MHRIDECPSAPAGTPAPAAAAAAAPAAAARRRLPCSCTILPACLPAPRSLFTMARSTLARWPDCMLGAMFRSELPPGALEAGGVFIDRCARGGVVGMPGGALQSWVPCV